jgi:hypothetical protein
VPAARDPGWEGQAARAAAADGGATPPRRWPAVLGLGRHDAARLLEEFSASLCDQVDLDTLTAEVLAVVDQAMQPTQVWLWQRPAGSAGR